MTVSIFSTFVSASPPQAHEPPHPQPDSVEISSIFSIVTFDFNMFAPSAAILEGTSLGAARLA